MTQVGISLLNIKSFDNIVIVFKYQLIFTVLNMAQMANIFIICLKNSTCRTLISSAILIILSIITNIFICIIDLTRTTIYLHLTIFFMLMKILMMFINKYYIVHNKHIKEIYNYITYSYEPIGMLILYILTQNIFDEPIINAIVIYVFLLLSIFAIQAHDQNNQKEQYFIILSFIMLFPTLVFTSGTSIYFLNEVKSQI